MGENGKSFISAFVIVLWQQVFCHLHLFLTLELPIAMLFMEDWSISGRKYFILQKDFLEFGKKRKHLDKFVNLMS